MTVGELQLVHRKELVSGGKRWCCACWRSDGDPGVRYERKIWGLSVVEACPVHGTALIQRCFACGRRQPVIARDVYVGVCGHCGVDLCETGTEFAPRAVSDAERQSWYAREAASLIDAVNVSQLLGFDADTLADARRRGLVDLLDRSTKVQDHPAARKQVNSWLRRWGRPSLEQVFSALWCARWPVAKLFPDEVRRIVAEPPGTDRQNRLADARRLANRVGFLPRRRLPEAVTQHRETDRLSLERGVDLFLDLVRRANRGVATGISYIGFIEHLHERSFAELRGRPWSQADVGEALDLAERVTVAAGGRQRVTSGDVEIEAGMDTFLWRAEPPHDRPLAAWDNELPYSREDWLRVFPEASRRLLARGQ